MGELAEELGEDPYALTVRLLREEGGSVGMIGFGMSEENTESILAHPLGMVCSDGGAYAPYGPLSNSSPHPRGYGSFPRVLGHYVRERGIMPLEAAIHKMTALPARKLRLDDRGQLAVGAVADLVVFDPDQVGDAATFQDPHQYPSGVPHVVVAGVVLSEAVAMARSGSPLRIELSRAWLAVACVVALVVFPAVWREIGALSEASLLVQMGIAAQGGVFWGVVMAGAEKGVGG